MSERNCYIYLFSKEPAGNSEKKVFSSTLETTTKKKRTTYHGRSVVGVKRNDFYCVFLTILESTMLTLGLGH